MANYANLKAAIDAVIKANGQQEITGPLLNQVLKAMVNALGAGYLFMGIAEHDTNPNTPDQNVFYIALEEGTYTHFGNAQVHFGISLLFWYGQWSVYNLVTFSNEVTNEVEEIPTSYAVFNALKDAAVYDVTAHTGQRFANLNSLLSSPDIDTLIPPSVRKAGMTIMFTSPAHAVQQQSQLFKHKFFFNAVDMSLFSNVNRWIGIETTVTQYSLNVPTSGAVFAAVNTAKVETIAEAGVFDVTANNDGATFASLSALLNDEDLETLIPVSRRKGGMSIKFVCTSDNKYVKFFCTADEFTTDVTLWESIYDNDIARLVKGSIYSGTASGNYGWLAYGFDYPIGTRVKNNGTTQVNLYETYSTSGQSHTLGAGQTIIITYPVRAIRDDGHSGDYEIEFVGCFDEISNLRVDIAENAEDIDTLNTMQTGLSYTGTASGNYGWLAYGFYAPSGMTVKNDGETQVNLYETYSTGGVAHTIAAGQTIVTNYPVRAIRDDGHSGSYSIKFVGVQASIDTLNNDVNVINYKLNSPEYTGTASSTYAWLLDGFEIPAGSLVYNRGAINLNLYENRSDSANYVTLLTGAKLVTTFPVRALRSISMKGAYDLQVIGYNQSIESLEVSAKETTIVSNTIISKNKATVQASLGNGETISVSTFPKSNEVGDILTLYGEFGTFGNGLIIGKGNANISSVYFLIDSTNITPKRYNSSEVSGTPVAHGLTFSTFIKVVVEYTLNGTKILIHTLNEVFTYTFEDYKEPNGFPRVTSVGTELSNVVFTCINKNMQNPIWAFGDSYMDFTSLGRELYWLKEWGYLNMLPNAFPGRDSTEALADVNRCLLYGTPKIIIWTLGMNDNQTQGTITTWQNNLNSLISLCQQKGIELVLATIPQPKSTSYRNKALMNAVVVASGYRYLDQNKALGANADGEWYGNGTEYDYQSSDNVHPSQYGAKAIATQMLIDIPEIASGKEL